MLIIEGMDGSGKSTLARILSKSPYHPEGHPCNYDEAKPYMDHQDTLLFTDQVLDRTTAISTMAYRLDQSLSGELMARAKYLQAHGAVFIYCRPPDKLLLDKSRHTVSEFDTAYTLEVLEKHRDEIISRYDEIFEQIPHIMYDYSKGAVKI